MDSGKGSHLSLYLAVNTLDTLPAGSKILTEFTLRIVDQGSGRLSRFCKGKDFEDQELTSLHISLLVNKDFGV